jgi:hypothetical protein
MELGIAATSAEAAEAADASASGLVTLPLDSPMPVICGWGEASAETARRSTAEKVRMVVVIWLRATDEEFVSRSDRNQEAS